jgi:hypothetical protein
MTRIIRRYLACKALARMVEAMTRLYYRMDITLSLWARKLKRRLVYRPAALKGRKS